MPDPRISPLQKWEGGNLPTAAGVSAIPKVGMPFLPFPLLQTRFSYCRKHYSHLPTFVAGALR